MACRWTGAITGINESFMMPKFTDAYVRLNAS